MKNNNILLSLKNVWVKFKVRGRELTAIRGISLDIYENEANAIVGESGAGKSVLTKALSGMLDSNGYISEGEILFNNNELSETNAKLNYRAKRIINIVANKLNRFSKLENGALIYQKIIELNNDKNKRMRLKDEEQLEFDKKINSLNYELIELKNQKQALDNFKDKEQIKVLKIKINNIKNEIYSINLEKKLLNKHYILEAKNDKDYLNQYNKTISKLNKEYKELINLDIDEEIKKRNLIIAKEIYLSIGRYNILLQYKYIIKLLIAFKRAMRIGIDLSNEDLLNKVFDNVLFRVKYIKEEDNLIKGICILDLAKIKYTKDWQQIRGSKIATVFQDPMTSLNPIVTIGKQITSIIMKHQNCNVIEARKRAIILMKKVGISNPEKRFDDYPFQYSGGMRQRIVIAIALSCKPKVLICDEPTTALDVTIQAQILKLIKDLQKEFHFTIIFITHDLGVVANIADRVAVLYPGQIVELGSAREIFYDPRHPYTWALLSSLPQLSKKGEKLYSINGTPPSLYNKIIGDPFALRNPYCLKIDTIMEPPLFKISETHYAKTWLCDPRAPKIPKPDIITNIHEKLLKAFNI